MKKDEFKYLGGKADENLKEELLTYHLLSPEEKERLQIAWCLGHWEGKIWMKNKIWNEIYKM